jgi:hypothetical protein
MRYSAHRLSRRGENAAPFCLTVVKVVRDARDPTVALARTSRTLRPVRSMTGFPRLFRGREQPYGTDISAR